MTPLTNEGGTINDDDDDYFVDDPTELIGQELHYKIKIQGAKGLPPKLCKGVYCKFHLKQSSINLSLNLFFYKTYIKPIMPYLNLPHWVTNQALQVSSACISTLKTIKRTPSLTPLTLTGIGRGRLNTPRSQNSF